MSGERGGGLEPACEKVRLRSRRDWAWEFLRRNPAYRADWARAGRVVAGTLTERLVLVDAAPELMVLRRWGVIFRG